MCARVWVCGCVRACVRVCASDVDAPSNVWASCKLGSIWAVAECLALLYGCNSCYAGTALGGLERTVLWLPGARAINGARPAACCAWPLVRCAAAVLYASWAHGLASVSCCVGD